MAAADVAAGREAMSVETLIGRHYKQIMQVIINSSSSRSSSSGSGSSSSSSSNNKNNADRTSDTPKSFDWDPHSASKASFEVLIRLCPFSTWMNHEKVLDIIIPQVQPKKSIEPGR